MSLSVSSSLLLAAFVLLFIRLLLIGRRPSDYPPGPPTLPILGNLHQMPTRDPHLQFRKWARQYGPIYSLILGTKTLIVLSSDEAVKELLDRRSAITSDRQDMYIAHDLCSDGLRMLAMRYGPTWRMMRRLSHNLMNISAAKSYVPYQMLENQQMLADILDTPHDILSHIRRYSNSFSAVLLYAWRTPNHSDPELEALYSGIKKFVLLAQTGTAAIIDFYPWARYLPSFLIPVQKEAREAHKVESALYMKHWMNAKRAVTAGTARPCFCVDLVRVQAEEGFSDKQAAYILGTFLEAGSDTTANTLYGFVQAMLLYPDAQRKAQAELDRVVGSERLPTMEDESALQYVRACVKEALRWMPTALLGGVPHAITRDDWYEGYKIPKGAGLLNNIWTIHRDPARYPEPERFNPDRYQDDFLSAADSAASSDVKRRDHFGFGAGRRVCAGMHVAERSLFLAMSRILWAFDILPALDEEGRGVLPEQDRLTQGFVCLPEKFEARIVSRSEARARLVREEWERAKAECLDEREQWKNVPEGMRFKGGWKVEKEG